MRINVRKRVLLKEVTIMRCNKCHIDFSSENNFCSTCGSKLAEVKTKIYCNYGKRGITSLSCKLPNGTVINSKGNLTIPLAKGVSYTFSKPQK